jgi:hypothetical protein
LDTPCPVVLNLELDEEVNVVNTVRGKFVSADRFVLGKKNPKKYIYSTAISRAAAKINLHELISLFHRTVNGIGSCNYHNYNKEMVKLSTLIIK